MLRISRLTDYATDAMTCLAEGSDEVRSTAHIAASTHLELPTVSKLMKQLGRAGLVESFRGVNGGYRLARKPEDISLAEIVEALEGPLGMTECAAAPGHCEREAHCLVRGNWRRINNVIAAALRAVSLADMVHAIPDTTPIPSVHAKKVTP